MTDELKNAKIIVAVDRLRKYADKVVASKGLDTDALGEVVMAGIVIADLNGLFEDATAASLRSGNFKPADIV